MNGSAAMNGAARIRPAVIALGRFTRPSPPLGERLQYELADSLERVENAIALNRYRLEVRRLLDPFSARQLLDEILTGVIRIGLDAMLGGVLDLPARIERSLEILDRRGVRQVSLVVLDHERHLRQVVSVLGHVVVEVLHGLEVRFHSLRLRVADKDNAIHILENELAAGVVVDLSGNSVQVEASLETANGSQIDGKEIEEQRSFGC